MSHLLRSAICLLIATLPLSAGTLPPRLDQVRRECTERLGAIYDLDGDQMREPMEITRAEPGEPSYEPWRAVPDYAAGAARGESGAIVIIPSRTGDYPFGDEAQTLQHELSHVLLYRALGYQPPRWLDEGLAMRAGGEWGVQDEWHLAFALPRAARGDYPLGRLESDFRHGEARVRRSYALARAFVGDLFEEDREVTEFLRSARAAGSVERAFRERFASTPDVAFQRWAMERPLWREWVVVLGSARTTWGVALVLFLAASLLAFLRRRRSYSRLPE